MVHLEETDSAPELVSDAAGASGDAPDAGYARRIDKEWRDQLASAQEANAGLDEHDVDARELYGEQAVHNFPDVHEDWGDAKVMAARAARMRAMAEMSPDSEALSASAEQSGWNTAYRAGLENALDAVRDSKKMMRNLKTIRQRQKDMDEGMEIGHLKGKTAKEANAEWEKQRLEARDAERRRRVAAAELAAANARATESKKSVAGLPSLPDFLKRSSLDADGEGAEAAARALAAKHGEWIRTLDGEGGMEAKDMEAKERQSKERRTSSASADSDADASGTPTKPLGAKLRSAASRDESAESLSADHRKESLTESLSNEEDTESSFFENLTSLSPLRRASRAKTDRDEDFWNREMWGGDDFDADGEIESAEAEMAKLCAAEISGARRLSVGEE
jgi:hypothetical protein